jgi:hypothetical protein
MRLEQKLIPPSVTEQVLHPSYHTAQLTGISFGPLVPLVSWHSL